MSNFYFAPQHHSSHSNLHNSHNHHAGRSRRATRASAAHHHQQHQKQMRQLRLQKEAEESAMERALLFRREFDAARSFDFDDDELFCPFNLMTDDDLQSMSSGSDRSSLASSSPEQSPVTQQIQPAPTFLLPPSNSFPSFQSHTQKLHQPLAQRTGAKAIPIVDPSTRNVASPPPSVSPARQMLQAQQFMPRRAW
ncbi:hypothetical protein BT63DRAFT_307438 [Microthyrium microscopicum]|uniref:Uncharacterized protein n=1 Tax=Microthyrium microscopicum TaxID=703497 RepID=A0A6A6U9B1_9PEZI|nr:hypothetical protein BT63DRAFT_307438 [Microthyrium microscopicum]